MAHSKMAMITFFEGGEPVDPSYGVPGGGYGGGHPSTGPVFPGRPVDPGYGRPSIPGSIGTLPVFPFDPSRPDQSLPGDQPSIDNSLPGSGGRPSNPIQLHPGLKLVVKWVACYGFVGVPDQGLPETPEPK